MVELFLFILCIAVIFLIVLFFFLMYLSGRHSEDKRQREFDEMFGRIPEKNPDGSVNPYGGYPDD